MNEHGKGWQARWRVFHVADETTSQTNLKPLDPKTEENNIFTQ